MLQKTQFSSTIANLLRNIFQNGTRRTGAKLEEIKKQPRMVEKKIIKTFLYPGIM